MILGTIGCLINGAINPVFAIIFSQIFTIFYKPPDQIKEEVPLWAGMFAVIGGAAFIATILQQFFFATSGEFLTQRLREISFKAIIRNEIGWFDFEENSTGVLTARLASDASLVEGLSGIRLGLTLQNVAALIAGLVIAFDAGWKLTLVVLACSPLMGFANAMHMQAMKGFSNQISSIISRSQCNCIRIIY